MSLNVKRIIIFVLGLALCVALLMVADQERRRHLAPEEMSVAQLGALVKDDSAACVECHHTKSPGIVNQWALSQHARIGVGCVDCHGVPRDDVTAWSHEGAVITSIVGPNRCAQCHPTEAVEFSASHHNTAGMILHSADNMLGEFIAGGPNAVLGCKQCHGSQLAFTKQFEDNTSFSLDMRTISMQVVSELLAEKQTDLKGLLQYKKELSERMAKIVADQWAPYKDKMPKTNTRLAIDYQTWPNSGMGRFNPDGSFGTCNACHPRHEFSRALARQPDNCGKCHMGPDHPQKEIYYESKHGIAFTNRQSEMNLDDPDWIVGEAYSAAPTCATCHMSQFRTADGVEPANHDVGLRISWTLRPALSTLTTSHSARINAAGREEAYTMGWQEKRNRMQGACASCHATSHIANFYSQYDALVNLYNEKFAKPGAALMAHVNAKGYLDKPEAKGFAHELNWIWFELWHHEGRRMRHGASMMGPDYTHWHGSYEVAKHFYVKFLPKLDALVEQHNDDVLKGMIKTLVFDRLENDWYNGMDSAEAEAVRAIYAKYNTLHLDAAEQKP